MVLVAMFQSVRIHYRATPDEVDFAERVVIDSFNKSNLKEPLPECMRGTKLKRDLRRSDVLT